MAKITNADNRQLNLDFNVPITNVEKSALNQSEVIRLNDYTQSRRLKDQTQSAMERLLQKAQKLRW